MQRGILVMGCPEGSLPAIKIPGLGYYSDSKPGNNPVPTPIPAWDTPSQESPLRRTLNPVLTTPHDE